MSDLLHTVLWIHYEADDVDVLIDNMANIAGKTIDATQNAAKSAANTTESCVSGVKGICDDV
jgi:hypothetical protein